MDGGLEAGVGGEGAKSEKLMDEYLKSQGLYRKETAKDGSCLFRAVAEQVLYCQSRHLLVRRTCAGYLLSNKDKYEAFVEGAYDDYLKRVENPQYWGGEVEISALSQIYKHDFIIFQEPGKPPVNVTENEFPNKVQLCFLNGNHYDSVYPEKYNEAAALCQSLLYELLYEKVFGVDVSSAVCGDYDCNGMGQESPKESISSVDSDSGSENDSCVQTDTSTDMNKFKSTIGNQVSKVQTRKEHPSAVSLSRSVLDSLNPEVYRNVEFDVWLKTQRAQQNLDYCIAAGMQYSVGDKCKVRLDQSGKYYNAYIQEVGAGDGQVVVFVKELATRQSIPVRNLEPPLQENSGGTWSTVPVKTKRPRPVNGHSVRGSGDSDSRKPAPKSTKSMSAVQPSNHQAAPVRSQYPVIQGEPKTANSKQPQPLRKCDPDAGLSSTKGEPKSFTVPSDDHRGKDGTVDSRVTFEVPRRDRQACPPSAKQNVSQVATQTSDTNLSKQSYLSMNEKQSTKQRAESQEPGERGPHVNLPEPNLCMKTGQKLEQPKVQASGKFACSPGPPGPDPTPPPPPLVNRGQPSTNTPSPLPADPPPYEAATCCMPGTLTPMGISPVPTASVHDPMMPQAPITSTPVAPYAVPMSAVNQPSVPFTQIPSPYQDPLYPGFPLNEKGERVASPPFSLCSDGGDLPRDKGVLRFFFNLGLKAYSCPLWPPHSYIFPLHQAYVSACAMQTKSPGTTTYAASWIPDCASHAAPSPGVHSTTATPAMPVQQNWEHQAAGRVHGQCSPADRATPCPPLPMPVVAPDRAPCSSLGPERVLCGSFNAAPPVPVPVVHMGGLPWPAYGQSPFVGSYSASPPVYSPFCVRYPVQRFPSGNASVGGSIEFSQSEVCEYTAASPNSEMLPPKFSPSDVVNLPDRGGECDLESRPELGSSISAEVDVVPFSKELLLANTNQALPVPPQSSAAVVVFDSVSSSKEAASSSTQPPTISVTVLNGNESEQVRKCYINDAEKVTPSSSGGLAKPELLVTRPELVDSLEEDVNDGQSYHNEARKTGRGFEDRGNYRGRRYSRNRGGYRDRGMDAANATWSDYSRGRWTDGRNTRHPNYHRSQWRGRNYRGGRGEYHQGNEDFSIRDGNRKHVADADHRS
ncbi:OTU domain-containing protein 4 [Erpetoichthys calabaricus]|uniref:OTU domain-containing protein 4 n=1 Tax=Erpetoichthys calabaricus TaxID=27687 RepID=UPI002234AD60|nr:OTU domain-containing protein 4 [Erpetoichthys calabaricus]